MSFRLGVLTSHPIQYQAPLHRALAAIPDVNLKVLFCSDWGTRTYRDPGFGVGFKWDVPLLDGYDSSFLRNFSPRPGPLGFIGLINPGIVARVLRHDFDALWINGWAAVTCWAAWSSAVVSGVPIMLRAETSGLNEPTGLKSIIKRRILSAMFSRVSALLTVGSNNKDFYRSYGVPEERLFSVPYTVDNDFFTAQQRNLGSREEMRLAAGLPVDTPLVLFCGKLLEHKRPFDVLQAALRCQSKRNVAVAFVGDGPLREQMERFVSENHMNQVYFLGFKNQTEITRYYALADVLVLPSLLEPWGLVVNEAMCCGLPVIVSDRVGCARDLVRHGKNGFVYPAGDVDELSECLRRVLSSGEARKQMGASSREVIRRWSIREDVAGVGAALEFLTSKREHLRQAG